MIHRKILLSAVLVSFFFLIDNLAAQDSPSEPGDIKYLEVTDLTLSGATFSWVTDEKTSSNWIEVRSSNPDTVIAFYDNYKQPGYVHFVVATGLSPETEYKYRAGSGSAVWDNEGALYSFSTFPVSGEIPFTSTILGSVKDTWDNPLERILVRIRVKSEGEDPSLARTLLTNSDGIWLTNYGEFRSGDGSLYNARAGDSLLVSYIPNYWSEYSDSSAVLDGNSPQNLGSVSVSVYDPNEVIKGDLDSNGAINIFDLLELLKILSGKLVPDNQKLFGAADVDTSGTINIFDLLALLALLKK